MIHNRACIFTTVYSLKNHVDCCLSSQNTGLRNTTANPKTSQPVFMKRSAELVDQLRNFTPKKLGLLMSISDKLAALNFDRYQTWQPKATKKNARQALLAFKGDVYQGIDAYSFKEADFLLSLIHI